MRIIRAKWIAPMSSPRTAPLILNGAVVVREGCIAAVGNFDDIKRDFVNAPVTDAGEVILLPGLVNAHTHLELSLADSGGDRAGMSFANWILSIRAKMHSTETDPLKLYESAVRKGIDQCRRFGVTAVGDIAQNAHLVRPTLRESGLHIVSFGETLGLAKALPRFKELLSRAVDESCKSDNLRIGLQPHAPYTVDENGFKECLKIATEKQIPLATHLAETTDEELFLRDQSGPFQEIWQLLGNWETGVKTTRTSPIRMADQIGLLAYPTLLAHVNYCDDEELDLLARGRANVVYCPRTHRYFDHPPHRFREMISRGINVAIGTDSCASSPDLNVVDDLRLVHQLHPDFPCEELWQMITRRGAKAISWESELGTIEPGKRADLTAFAARSNDPLREILENSSLPIELVTI